MAVEALPNGPSTVVFSGGTTAPAAGTTETWLVASPALFPAASGAATPPTQFHITDPQTSEICLVSNTVGGLWTVTRGALGTTPVAHAASGFTVAQVIASGALASLVTPLSLPSSALSSLYAPVTSVVQAQRATTTSDLATSVLAASTPPAFAPILASGPQDVIVDPDELFQPFLGVGAALTDAAAYVMWTYMTPAQRTALLTYLYSPSQCGWSVVRVPMGSPDFRSEAVGYTYDDLPASPAGQTDTTMAGFSVLRDTQFIIPILQQIMQINPGVRIIATPWSAPAWMLSSGSFEVAGGIINPTYYAAYAQYFVDFIQAYQSYGVPVWAVTPANEPVGSTIYTAMSDSVSETFIGTYLGPAIQNAGLATRIFCLDDNWTSLNHAQNVLGNSTAVQYLSGVAWHGYGGTPADTMAQFAAQFPGMTQLCTEWRSLSSESIALQMQGMAGGYVVGSARGGAAAIVLWNMALDQNGNPTQGSTGRIGAVTVNNTTGAVTPNAGAYALTHLSAFVQPGARRCQSSTFGPPYNAYTTYPSQVTTVAYRNPDSSIVLYAYNGAATSQTFQIIDRRTGQGFPVTMVAGELSTFTWGTSATLSPSAATGTAAAPSAPTLTATGGAGQVQLSWTTPASAAPINWYVVSRGTASGGETSLAVVPAGTTSYTDLTGAAGTWFYTVTAVSAGGPGTASAERSATATAATAPSAPVLSGGPALLSWTTPSANGSAITGYTVSRGTSSGGETLLATVGKLITSYFDGSAALGTTYYYKVAAINAIGTGTSSNEVSGTLTAGVDNTVTPASTSTSVTNFTWSHTTGSNPSRLLLVAVGYGGSTSPAISGVTYGGTAMTHLITVEPEVGNAHDKALDWWYLLAPPSGPATVDVSQSQSSTLVCASLSLFGVNQTTPLRTPQPGSTTSGTSASAATTGGAVGDLVLAALHLRLDSGATTPGAGQTDQAATLQAGSTNNWLEITTQAGGTGTITSSWSWPSADVAAVAAVAVVPV